MPDITYTPYYGTDGWRDAPTTASGVAALDASGNVLDGNGNPVTGAGATPTYEPTNLVVTLI